MQATAKPYLGASSDLDPGNVNFTPRRAVGYVRVSTDIQANEGLSLDAQTATTEQYCILHGLKLHSICRDVISGARDQRPGLQEALENLQRGVDVLIVLKFDRLSRSIKPFCELCETYFKSGEKSLSRFARQFGSIHRWVVRWSASCSSLLRWSAKPSLSGLARRSGISGRVGI